MIQTSEAFLSYKAVYKPGIELLSFVIADVHFIEKGCTCQNITLVTLANRC